VEIFNRHGMKGTFHLNSGSLGNAKNVTRQEVPGLYKGHEIAAHMKNHPWPSQQPAEVNMAQLIDDRRALEELAGYPVRGLSYPFGDYGNGFPVLLPAAGVDYSRTTNAHHSFRLPDDFLTWNPTCHHNSRLNELWEDFTNKRPWQTVMRLMYVWGHSYEFDNDNNWDLIESFCEKAAGTEDIWYATNGQVMDYIVAMRCLKWSVEGGFAVNPSGISVYARIDGGLAEIKPGHNTL
jgi:peptidoglycan/xylan/chitin deacetylase (PgdA/CDA1 family)